ncbi:MAG: hypothetical protein WA421_01570, partial [Nitrososphaeraceae archaeon]
MVIRKTTSGRSLIPIAALMLMGMLFTATAASVNRVIAGSHIGLNSANPEKTQVLPRTVVLDPSTLVKL